MTGGTRGGREADGIAKKNWLKGAKNVSQSSLCKKGGDVSDP